MEGRSPGRRWGRTVPGEASPGPEPDLGRAGSPERLGTLAVAAQTGGIFRMECLAVPAVGLMA